MAGRPKQPKCKSCGKALYKRMDPGKVKPSDSYAWCRNESCKKYNKPLKATRFKPLGVSDEATEVPPAVSSEEKAEKSPPVPKRRRRARPTPIHKQKPSRDSADTSQEKEVSKEKEEKADKAAEAVRRARARIKAVVDAVDDQFGSSAVGLALALVSQETGNNEAANILIRDYNLTELFGINPK